MRPKELLVILLLVVSFSQWQKGHAQKYYDLYSNNEFYRAKKNHIGSEVARAVTSSSPSQTKSSSSLPVMTVNYGSLIGHPASPTPLRVPTLVAIVSTVAVILIIIVLWLIHLVRKSVSRRDSGESFSIPMPEQPLLKSSVLAPQLSVTSPAGLTTHLRP
ncbi:hypothetical protein OS493_027166 [Desmophyllum pertusum]|uniref:Uncharacterized protein n=1 Tax=Desmophyllum pertusum TaxID=174260 RepID=A0A9W9ZZ89_9CNID|nr:hypothetical protein OS493_027166 [Desmophyllum pertusum]